MIFLFIASLAHAEEPIEKALEEGNPFNIGNAFFRLEQYPWAVLYYARALKENPQNARAAEYLDLALQRLPGPNTPPTTQTPEHLFLWFFLVLAAATLLGSISIWRPALWLNALFGFFVLIAAGLLSYATIDHYFTPIPAVMVQSSPLYRSPDPEADTVGNAPVFAGSAIGVIEVSRRGAWFKVETSEGTIGYLPLKSLRII